MYSTKDTLKISTILEFIMISKNALDFSEEKYHPGVKILKRSLYVKDYEFQFDDNSILVLWRNQGNEKYWISYKNSSSKNTSFSRFLSKLKGKIFGERNFATNSEYHALSSLEEIFEDFKNEYDITAEFNDLNSTREGFYKVLYEVHRNFFEFLSFNEYCQLIHIDKTMERKDYETLLRGCPNYCN